MVYELYSNLESLDNGKTESKAYGLKKHQTVSSQDQVRMQIKQMVRLSS